jgi:Ni/Co efflux regulator RcnB
MKKLLSLFLGAAFLVAPMALVVTPAVAKTHTQVSSQAQGAPASVKTKNKMKKAKKAKKAGHKVKKAKKHKTLAAK